MARVLALLHTFHSLIELFDDLAGDILPADVQVVHIVDGLLLKAVLEQGGLSPFLFRRVADHIIAAEESGANAAMLTCSSIAPCVEAVRPMVNIPVLRIDEPMVDRALSLGTRIGVAATAPTTLKPILELIYVRAELANKRVSADPVMCQGAYAAMFAGDMETHDRIVLDTLRELASRNDVVVLAQASMARIADMVPPEEQVAPILSTPRLAIERVRDVMSEEYAKERAEIAGGARSARRSWRSPDGK